MNEPMEQTLRDYLSSDRFDADPELASRIRRGLPIEADVATAEPARPRPRFRRRRAWLAAAVAALLAAVVATASVVEAGGSPIPGRLLQAVGLAPASGRGPAVRDAAPERSTAAGHTLTLLGTYGDTLRTVVFVGGEPAVRFAMARLFDESGRELRPAAGSTAEIGGEGDGRIAMQFEPLPVGSHRLTLRVQGIYVVGRMVGDSPDPWVLGSWELHPSVQVARALEVPARPAAGTLGQAAVAITSISGGGDAFLVTVETRGADPAQLIRMTEGVRQPAPGAFEMHVTGPHGEQLQLVGEPAPAPRAGPGGDPLDIVQTFYWRGAGAGTYRLALSFEGQQMESTFTLG